jgi:very-short-patch-repair endonuclease
MRVPLTGVARMLRRQETPAEHLLWSKLRARQVDGWKFKRQVPYGPYILDIYCADAGLAIEVDGMQHLVDRAQHDGERAACLKREGVRVLRFWNSEVSENLAGVLEPIYLALGQQQAPSPGALRRQKSATTRRHARRPLPKGRGDAATSEEDRAKK